MAQEDLTLIIGGVISTVAASILAYVKKSGSKRKNDDPEGRYKQFRKELKSISDRFNDFQREFAGARESFIEIKATSTQNRDAQERIEGELIRIWERIDEDSKLLSKMIGSTEATLDALTRAIDRTKE